MMLKSQKNTFCVLVIFCVGITIVVCGKVPIRKRSLVVLGSGEPSDVQLRPNKRTFCNAFTGCGGKRSDASMPPKQPDYEYEHDSLGERDSDDSVDDVARDILAEARLYEALQARNSMRLAQNRRPGFFPRQKRSPTNLDNYLIDSQKSFKVNNNKGQSQESSKGISKSQNIL